MKRYPDQVDPTIKFLYEPRNVSMVLELTQLVIVLLSLVYMSLYVLQDDQIVNTKVFDLFDAVVFLVQCLLWLLLESSSLRTVHLFARIRSVYLIQAIWRFVLALGVVYQMILVVVLFQFVDPTLGVKLPEKSYAENCDFFSYQNWYDQMDVFVFAHVFGWVAKALILRDAWLCWIISILFEIMEYSLQHQLPNFAECWWDHWILDVLTANWLGIFIGMKLCDYFAFKTYSWRGIGEIPTYEGKLKRTVQQFTPHSWTSFDWAQTKSYKGFIAVLIVLTLELICELNAFYLKYLLWIPVSSNLNLYRLLFMFLMCLPAVREAYQFLTDAKCKRLGMHAWLTTSIIVTELLICIKFGQGEFPTPFPNTVIIFWIALTSFIAAYAIWRFILYPKTTPKTRQSKKTK